MSVKTVTEKRTIHLTAAHDANISFCRLVAMCFIVGCHILQHYNNELAWWFNCGVQIFICISGFLYGQRKVDDWYQFIKNRFLKILSGYYVCLIIDLFFMMAFSNQVIGVKNIILMIFCKGTITGLGHLWFVGTILFCYLLTPLLSKVYNDLRNKKCFIILFLGISGILCVIIEIHTPQFNPIWILCYILGYLIGKLKVYDIKWLHKTVMFFVPLCVIMNAIRISINYIYCISFEGNLKLLYSCYENISHVFLGISLFALIYAIYDRFNRFGSVFLPLLKISDKYSYDIYLVHHVWILGPLSIFDLKYPLILRCIILIAIICVQSYIVHAGANCLINKLIHKGN